MTISLLLAVVLLGGMPPPSSPAASICTSTTGVGAKTVAYLRGSYGVVGLRAGQPYTGRLTLSGVESSETLDVSGAVAGLPRNGSARYVDCGPDRVRQLEVNFGAEQVLYCVPHHDYDNLSRASCAPSLSDPDGDQELWFQRFVP